MLKFINRLATIEVNNEIEAIQVVFRGSGTVQHYLETLRMSISFAKLHSINAYLLIKNEFDDVSCQQFYSIIEDWLHLVDEDFNQLSLNKVRVALLTNQNSYKELSERASCQPSPKDYIDELFALFSEKEKARNFLLAKPVKKSYQSI